MEPPRPPDDIEMKNIIDKLAQFVARNGPDFERMTKSKQENNPKFAFLWGGPYFNYYTYKVTTEQTVMRHKQNQMQQQQQNSGPRPLMDIDLSGSNMHGGGGGGNNFNNGGGNSWSSSPAAAPEPPNTSALTDQIASLQSNQMTLQDQIKTSEQNLAAQWTVLQQNNEIMTRDQIMKAQEADLEDLSRATNVSLSIFDSVLQPIIESCTKDAISSGKSWIFQNSNSLDCNRLMANYLNFKVTSPTSDFTTKLHIVYLVNDVLHHCVRKNNLGLKSAFEKVAVSMYTTAACIATEEQMPKLSKLVTLWETKSKFFEDEVLEKMRDFKESAAKYREDQEKCYGVEISAATQPGIQTYEGYKAQHEQFVSHAENQSRQITSDIDSLQMQLNNIEQTYKAKLQDWQLNQEAAGQQTGGGGNRRSRWDRTAPLQDGDRPVGGTMPGVPMADLSRPPPGFQASDTVPTAPYYDLPAGLMVSLVKFDESEYKSIDPGDIRLPPPQPPSDRLMAAVQYFYSAPTHDRPRDPDGWERLALYDWSREKQFAIRQKKEDIESGRREKSRTTSPGSSRESTPDQTVPQPSRVKRYRSRSRSREHTPTRRTSRRGRSRTRSRTRSRSRSRSRTRSRSRSRGRSRTRSGSGDNYSRNLTKRSPSPRHYAAGDDRLGDSNKGHQMLQKMGWKGAGLGSQESGIVDPVSGGEVRDRNDQFKGVGVGADPFEDFRKQRAGKFYTRMVSKAEDRKKSKREDVDDY